MLNLSSERTMASPVIRQSIENQITDFMERGSDSAGADGVSARMDVMNTVSGPSQAVDKLITDIFDIAAVSGARAAWHRCVLRVDFAIAEGVQTSYWEKYLGILVNNILDAWSAHGSQAALDSVKSYAECVHSALLTRDAFESDPDDPLPGPTQYWNSVQIGTADDLAPQPATEIVGTDAVDENLSPFVASPTQPW